MKEQSCPCSPSPQSRFLNPDNRVRRLAGFSDIATMVSYSISVDSRVLHSASDHPGTTAAIYIEHHQTHAERHYQLTHNLHHNASIAQISTPTDTCSSKHNSAHGSARNIPSTKKLRSLIAALMHPSHFENNDLATRSDGTSREHV